jgi:paraquat-inducible protein B
MDERAVGLLEEIRNLQREHLELYRQAVRNQEDSIRMQREAQDELRRRMKIVWVLGIVAIGLALSLLWLLVRPYV